MTNTTLLLYFKVHKILPTTNDNNSIHQVPIVCQAHSVFHLRLIGTL